MSESAFEQFPILKRVPNQNLEGGDIGPHHRQKAQLLNYCFLIST